LLETSLSGAYKNITSECNMFVDDMTEINKLLYDIENRNTVIIYSLLCFKRYLGVK
jgi:hypothetical protein